MKKNRRLIVENSKVKLISNVIDDLPIAGCNLIKIAASGLNRADILQTKGLYSLGDNEGLGLEFSGINLATNQLVCAIVPFDAHSDFIQVENNLLLPIPNNIDLVTAASLPETLLTCWLNLFELGKLKSNENVLIHGGSSGIGSMAIQIAKQFCARVFATVGSDNKIDKCLSLGADNVYNYHDSNYVAEIKRHGGCDLVLDILGGDGLNNNIKLLNRYGRIISIAVMRGSQSQINLGSLLMKNLTIIGSTLRSKTVEEKKSLITAVVKNLYPLLENGLIQPVIDSVYAFEDFDKAYKRLESREHFGKIILKR